MDFKLKDGEKVRTVRCTKAAGVTITPGRLVTLSAGLVIEAVTASATVAFAPNGAASADLFCDVTVGNDFTLQGSYDSGTFAVADKGAACDISAAGGAQTINPDANTYKVLRIGIAEDAGVVASADDVEVRIILPLF